MVCRKWRGETMSATAALAHEQNIRLAPAHGKLRVLLVEDNPSDIELVSRELRRGGFDMTFEVAQTEQEFVERVRSNSYQVVLADCNLPQWRGMEAVNVLRKENLDIPVILVSGALGDVTAVECIKQGAVDYVLKDRLARLPTAVLSALQEKRLRDERQRAVDDLAKKVEELARSNRELEQFAYVASHDLQEPLRMVAAYTQLLAERYKGKLDEPADKYIHYAVDGAKRMQTLVQDLLAFSRVGRLNTEIRDTDCNVAVEIAIANLQVAIRETDARITHDHLPVVLANHTQLAQVFQNLIGNAIKFRGPKAPQIQITVEKQADEWLFSVADNGIGIAAEYCRDIFVIFKRLHTRAEYPGNGIGLAICRKIIEQYGGRIWVTSQEGVGSTFKFTLPVSEAGSPQRQNRDDHR
jgi:signal transduction histidine kinase